MTTDSLLAERAAPVRARSQSRRLAWLVPALPAVAALLVTAWRLDGVGYWRDETATIAVAHRSFSEIFGLLGDIDAVHGLYYVLMHPVVTVFGTGEIATRTPSVAAAVVTAALTAMIGRRIADGRVGLVAGLLVAVAPAISRYAQEARQYALATALAVAATYLLVRASERGDRRWFAAYALAVALLGWLQIFALLLLPAHAVAVATARERTLLLFRRWLAAAALAVLAVVPLVLIALPQRRSQVDWIPKPDGGAVRFLLEMLAGGPWLIVPVLVLIVLAVVRPVRRATPLDPRWTFLAWSLLPPAILLGTSFLMPNYVFRYVLFCVPAVALLVALALRRLPLWIGVPGVAALALATLPVHVLVRDPYSRPDDIRTLAAHLRDHQRPGDAVVFNDQRFRRVAAGYPDAFRDLNDVALATSGAASRSLDGKEVSPDELARRLATVQRVWLLWRNRPSDAEVDHAKYRLIPRDIDHWRKVARHPYKGGAVTLYERR